MLSTGLLDAALTRFTPDDVTIACGPIPAPLFQAVPKLKNIIVLNKAEKGAHWLKFWAEVVGTKWDVVIDLRNSFFSYFLFAKKTYRFTQGDPGKHKVEQLAAVLGLPEAPLNKIWLNETAKNFAQEKLPDGAPILALCPTANWVSKQWPATQFVRAAKLLPFSRIAVFGAAHEAEQAAPIIQELKKTHEVIDLVGKTDPLQAAACLQRTALCLANDSGLMHIAAAMGTTTLGLFGPSRDEEYRPWGQKAAFVRGAAYQGLDKTPEPQKLMEAIGVDEVVKAAQQLLKQ